MQRFGSKSFIDPKRNVALVLTVLVSWTAFSQSIVDSLIRILPEYRGKERVALLGDIQWELGMHDAAAALAYGLEALKIAETLKDSAAVAQAANDLSITEFRLGHLKRAIDLNMRALLIRRSLGDTIGAAASHSKIAVAYTDQMNFDSALVHNYAAAAIYEQVGDLPHAAQVRGNIGHLYQQMGDLHEAEKIIRATVEQLRDQGVSYPLATNLGQLCQVLEQSKKLEEAEVVGKEALIMFGSLGMKQEIAGLNNEMGVIARSRGDDATGLLFYRKALELATEIGDDTGRATYGLNVANVLLETGRVDASLPYYRESLMLCRDQGYADQHMSALIGYIKALEATGDLRGAIERQRELLALRDSVYKADRLTVIGDMQVKYDTERTEKELALSREKEEAQRSEIQRRRLIQGALITGLLLLIALAALFISRQRARHTARLNQELIAEREKGLKAVIASTEAERKHIAAELHDGVGQQLTGLKYRLEDLGERVAIAMPAERQHIADVRTIADDAGRDVRGIAHRMMPRALGELGLAPAIEDMLRKAIPAPTMRYEFEQFGLEERLPSEIEIGVFRIAQELVNNILKHAQATEVNVQLLRNKGHLIMIVVDNGQGFDPDLQRDGLGMRNMMDRARVMHGTIGFERVANGGSSATLRIPLP